MDIVVAAAFDRFGRSVRHLVEALEVFRHLDVEIVSLGEQVEQTQTPRGARPWFEIVTAARVSMEGDPIHRPEPWPPGRRTRRRRA